MNQEKWNKICADTVNTMIDHLQPCLSPISRVLPEDEGEHLGSGAYFESDQKKFIITNEHVAKYLKSNLLTHSFFECEDIFRLTNPAFSTVAPIDVAISRISETSWNKSEHQAFAIPISRFAFKHDPVEHEVLFFAGYSGERSKFVLEHLVSRGTPYLTQECPFPNSVNEADQHFHFSLFYPPDLATSIDGKSHLPDPHGFSGSLVWDTKRVACHQEGKEWNPKMAEVTGIVWGWPSSKACILATKIEHLGLNKLMDAEIHNA